MKPLPKITEPVAGLVHYQSFPWADSATLCGLSNFLGHRKAGKGSSAKVTCRRCIAIVEHIHNHAKPEDIA